MKNPTALVSRVFKARYFSDSHIMEAKKGQNPSFIWQGLLTALDSLRNRFRWVVGNGEDIRATKDRWLRAKKTFCVEDDHMFIGRSERMSNYITPGTEELECCSGFRELFAY